MDWIFAGNPLAQSLFHPRRVDSEFEANLYRVAGRIENETLDCPIWLESGRSAGLHSPTSCLQHECSLVL